MIYCFSGTGNSRAVALRLSARLNEKVRDLSGQALRLPSAEKTLGLVFPVHAWGLPREVERFVGTFGGTRAAYCYAVLTCGDDCGLAAESLRRLLHGKGQILHYAASVRMPNTYIPFPFFDVDDKATERRKLAECEARIDTIASQVALRAESCRDVVRGSFPWLKSRVFQPFFRRILASPRHFSVSGACTRCGKCVRVCPLHNLTLEGARPVYGDRCTDCLACYHACPSHAIGYTPFSQGKGQYLHPDFVKKFYTFRSRHSSENDEA